MHHTLFGSCKSKFFNIDKMCRKIKITPYYLYDEKIEFERIKEFPFPLFFNEFIQSKTLL